MRLPSFDIRSKVAGLAFALVSVVVCALTIHFSARQVDASEHALEGKALTYARLLSRQAESAIALDDAEMARELFEGVAIEPDFKSVALYESNGAVLGALGEPTIEPKEVSEAAIRRSSTVVAVIAPVVSREGPRGVLVIELSTESLERDAGQARRAGLITGLIALAVGLLASWLIGGSFAKRVGRIQRATQAVARGKLNERPIDDPTKDEIGDLARAFNTMSCRIHDLVECIATDGQEEAARLEELVDSRTDELKKRNQDLAFFLEHIDQGFVTVDRDGVLAPERSAILGSWFTGAADAVELWDLIAKMDERAAKWLAIGWESVFDGMLPYELALDQLPKELRCGEETFGVRYQPIGDGEEVDKVIVVISNISTEIARRRAEATQQELATIFARTIADPAAVQLFVVEGTSLVGKLLKANADGASLVDQEHWIHTLKGNAACLGLGRLAELCHTIEMRFVDVGEPPKASAYAELAELWEDFTSMVQPFLVGRSRNETTVSHAALSDHITSIRAGKPRHLLAAEACSWRLEPTRERLDWAAEQARSVARRLDKSIEVVVEDNGARLDPQIWSTFWLAFVHVVRNAVDHGIEDHATRELADKRAGGKIVLRTFQTATDDVVEIEDDGAGIDAEALRERASRLGISGVSIVDLLFTNGISTKVEVTDTSGRGVGLGASRAACEAMGGCVSVTTTAGVGTLFTFRVPRQWDHAARTAA